jgi:tetratricopeptide (TPR) repeat protein
MTGRPPLVALLWISLVFLPAAHAQQAVPDLSELADETLELLNLSRQEAGLNSLTPHKALSMLATRHSQEQAARGRISHYSYEFGLSTERRIFISYPDLDRLAENVARNRSVKLLHEALLRSDGHRQNRMDPKFTHVGVGLARANSAALYLTEIFVAAPKGRDLGDPVAFYFDASPGSYEQGDGPLIEVGTQVITVGRPGPDDPEHWTVKGIDAYQSGDLQAAKTFFQISLSLNSDYRFAKYNLSRVLLETGLPGDAAILLDELLNDDPSDLAAKATRGNAAILLENFKGAENIFRAVLVDRLDDAASWYGLGLALEYQDRIAEAESAYRQALHIDPTLAPAQIGLARVTRH